MMRQRAGGAATDITPVTWPVRLIGNFGLTPGTRTIRFTPVPWCWTTRPVISDGARRSRSRATKRISCRSSAGVR